MPVVSFLMRRLELDDDIDEGDEDDNFTDNEDDEDDEDDDDEEPEAWQVSVSRADRARVPRTRYIRVRIP